jgi:hypothetical protein
LKWTIKKMKWNQKPKRLIMVKRLVTIWRFIFKYLSKLFLTGGIYDFDFSGKNSLKFIKSNLIIRLKQEKDSGQKGERREEGGRRRLEVGDWRLEVGGWREGRRKERGGMQGASRLDAVRLLGVQGRTR